MIYAVFFLFFILSGTVLALVRGPFWAALTCILVYFVHPQGKFTWWGSYIPFQRWSLLCTVVLILSCILHKNKLSGHRLRSLRWAIPFIVLSWILTFTNAVNKIDAFDYSYMLSVYFVTIWCFIRSVVSVEQIRLFLLFLIVLTANLSLKAYLFGKRIHERLENIGTVDANQSNEFALLIASVLPFLFLFAVKGNKYERIIVFLSVPFIINAFILCNSRGATVALLLSGFMSVLMVSDREIKKITIVMVVLTIPVFLYLTDDAFIQRFSSLLGAQEALQGESSASELSSNRTDIWRYGFEMVKDYPFGAGPNGFKTLARSYIPAELLTFHRGAEYGVRAAHNSYLQVLVEQGYLGLIVWLILCCHSFYLIVSSFRSLKFENSTASFFRMLLFSLSISYVSILLGGLFNSRVYYEFFWWQLAIIVITVSLADELIKKQITIQHHVH